MLKKITAILFFGVIIVFGFSGCFGTKYKVDYCGSKESFRGAKDAYRVGQEVTLRYEHIATDTDYTFYVDEKRVNPDYSEKNGFTIAFTMPAHDITVRVEARNTMLPEPNEKQAVLSYHSFDGGGPKYTVKIEGEQIVGCEQANVYKGKKDPTASGTPYTVEIVFTGLKEGAATACIEARSPTGIRYDDIYDIAVDADLKVTATLRERIEGGRQQKGE